MVVFGGRAVSYERGTPVSQWALTPYRRALGPTQDLFGAKFDPPRHLGDASAAAVCLLQGGGVRRCIHFRSLRSFHGSRGLVTWRSGRARLPGGLVQMPRAWQCIGNFTSRRFALKVFRSTNCTLLRRRAIAFAAGYCLSWYQSGTNFQNQL